MLEKDPVIIVKKKGGAHGGHHGGAWKVAYADFVTAMMSLFIVLWLMNCNKNIQQAVGGYFRDPFGSAKKVGNDIGGTGSGKLVVLGGQQDLNKVKNEMLKALESLPGFDKLKNQIEIKVTPEGLRIEMMEKPNGTFFENGKADPQPPLREILKILAEQTGKLPNPVSIEGHTDSKPFSDSTSYGNWELSTDRANAARRLMEGEGLKTGQVVQVRGFADRKLRKPDQPFDASNRRISILIQYMGEQELPSYVSDGALSTAPKVEAVAATAKPAAKH